MKEVGLFIDQLLDFAIAMDKKQNLLFGDCLSCQGLLN